MNATGESDMQNYYDYIDGLRETELRPVLEKLLPIMAMSAWGTIPEDINIDFPPMQTPDAGEVAEIAEKKTNAVIMAYQTDLIDAATAQMELQNMSEDIGLFGNITDESIKAGKGATYSSKRMLSDPMSGLSLQDFEEGGEDIEHAETDKTTN